MAPQVAFAQTTGTTSVQPIVTFIQGISQAMIVIGTAVTAIFIGVGGFKYITSSGNPQELESAKKTLIYAVVGVTILIASAALNTIATNMATSAFGGH